MNITSLSAAQASSPISVVVDMGLKELTAYEVVVFLEDAIGNVSSRLVSPHATTLDETPPAVVAFAVDAAATTETSISACIKAYDAGSTFSVYAKAFAAGVSVADSDTVEKLGGASALVAAGVTNASETDATNNPIDIDLTDLTASTAYDIVVLMVDTATPVPNILRYQYTQQIVTQLPAPSRSVEFDGGNQSLWNTGIISNNISSSYVFTFSGWFKPNNTLDEQIYVSFGDTYDIRQEGHKFRLATKLAGSPFLETINVPSGSTWFHMAFVSEGESTCKFYVNGIDANASDWNISRPAINTRFTIGAQHDNNKYLVGFVDEVSLYNKALSESEVVALYNNGTPGNIQINSDLVAYYDFNDDSLDRSGNGYHLTAVTGSPTFSADVPALFDRSVEFGTSRNDGLFNNDLASTSYFGGNSFTITGWFQHQGDDEAALFGFTTHATSLHDIRIEGGRFRYVYGTNPYLNTTTVPSGWFHFAFVSISATNCKLYVNGIGIDTSEWNGPTRPDINGRFIIGSNSHYDRSFVGQINDVAIFNTDLDASGIAAIYNNGTPLDLRTNIGDYTSSGALQAYWKFDGDYFDRSGNGYHLTKVGSPTFSYSVPTVIQKYVQFNGSNGLRNTTAFTNTFNSTNATYAGWINYNSVSNDSIMRFFETRNLDTHAHSGIGIQSGNDRFQIHGKGQSTTTWSPSTNIWYHFAWTKSNNVNTFYVNGHNIGSETQR